MSIFIVPLFTVALLILFLFFAKQGQSIRQWLRSLGSSGVEASGAKFSDFVSFTGFGLTVVGIILSWYTIALQTRKANIESQLKEQNDVIANQQQKLREVTTQTQRDFAHDIDIHLEYPTRDVSLINHRFPELQWRYSRHNERVDYLIEVIRIDADERAGIRSHYPGL